MEKLTELEVIKTSPFVGMAFWHELSKKKLEEYKLDDSEKPISVTYKINNYKDNKSNINLDENSFHEIGKSNKISGPVEIYVPGTLKNLNTIEKFNEFDREAFFHSKAKAIQATIETIAEKGPSGVDLNTLNTFLLLTFADLKRHVFSFCSAVPSVKLTGVSIHERNTITKALNETDKATLEGNLKAFIELHQSTPFPAIFFMTKAFELHKDFDRYVKSLKDGTPETLVYLDSYNSPEKYGQFITNYLALLTKLKLKAVPTLVLKDFITKGGAKVTLKNSEFLVCDLSAAQIAVRDDGSYVFCGEDTLKDVKTIDLKSQLDETALARNAVDLNIKLMKWRLLPELNIEKIQSLKCLMFGAGTLGCQLARNLIGWGVKNISFIDYGKVSHSNPVRQTLYDFDDSKDGGKPKAECAAAKLQKIYPEIESKGYSIEIPMPGHFAETPEKKKRVSETLDLLEQLVESHDAIFLLTDNRESRWLPTVLANKFNKICITVGLGFETFVVVRHGASSLTYKEEELKHRLGCYFCNDVLSPQDTMKDRTLDQQCTVTRPGLSFISSAYASELLISLIHHPSGVSAPGFDDEIKGNEETPLGILPQHLRGNLSDFETKIFLSKAFENCVACSNYVLHEFSNNRDEFMFKVMNDPDYIQSVAKITDFLNEIDEGNELIVIEDDF